MSDNEIMLEAKVRFLASQLSQAIDALCDATGGAAVLRDRLTKAEARIAELEPKG